MSDYQAWRALLHRCMSELGLVVDPRGAVNGVMSVTVDQTKCTEAFICDPPSNLDLVAAVDAHLAARRLPDETICDGGGKLRDECGLYYGRCEGCRACDANFQGPYMRLRAGLKGSVER